MEDIDSSRDMDISSSDLETSSAPVEWKDKEEEEKPKVSDPQNSKLLMISLFVIIGVLSVLVIILFSLVCILTSQWLKDGKETLINEDHHSEKQFKYPISSTHLINDLDVTINGFLSSPTPLDSKMTENLIFADGFDHILYTANPDLDFHTKRNKITANFYCCPNSNNNVNDLESCRIVRNNAQFSHYGNDLDDLKKSVNEIIVPECLTTEYPELEIARSEGEVRPMINCIGGCIPDTFENFLKHNKDIFEELDRFLEYEAPELVDKTKEEKKKMIENGYSKVSHRCGEEAITGKIVTDDVVSLSDLEIGLIFAKELDARCAMNTLSLALMEDGKEYFHICKTDFLSVSCESKYFNLEIEDY